MWSVSANDDAVLHWGGVPPPMAQVGRVGLGLGVGADLGAGGIVGCTVHHASARVHMLELCRPGHSLGLPNTAKSSAGEPGRPGNQAEETATLFNRARGTARGIGGVGDGSESPCPHKQARRPRSVESS
eukprot:1161643-Pelagomonas_calceolata.AAC.4